MLNLAARLQLLIWPLCHLPAAHFWFEFRIFMEQWQGDQSPDQHLALWHGKCYAVLLQKDLHLSWSKSLELDMENSFMDLLSHPMIQVALVWDETLNFLGTHSQINISPSLKPSQDLKMFYSTDASQPDPRQDLNISPRLRAPTWCPVSP